MNLVRRSDYDYYLTGLLMPEASRAGFFALRAFNVETGTIVDSVRGNVLPGRIRMQWWRDVIEEIYSSGTAPVGSQVAESLRDAVLKHDLQRRCGAVLTTPDCG